MILQIVGAEPLVSEAVKVGPSSGNVYGYLVLLLICLVLGLIAAVYQLFKKYETLSEKVFSNALEQTRTFATLTSYMERHNDGVTELSSTVSEMHRELIGAKDQVLRKISVVGIKLQRDETIQDPD